MRLTVFGATGRTGSHVVSQAIAHGHQITAFTRRPEALEDPGSVAQVVVGDGRDPQAVVEAVAGADAVIAILAPRSPRGPHHVAEVARVIARAMGEAGVRRLVITSAYPLVARSPKVPLAVLRFLLAATFADARAMEEMVAASDLDWTIARLNRLTDGPSRGGVRVTPRPFDKPSALTRRDAAATLLSLAEDANHARGAVNVAGPLVP